jgi:excinuclease ABC subunit C
MIQNFKKLPKNPGVYFFRDKNRRILYIGKAANLKNRLKSYFDTSPKNPRLQKMLETAKNVDWQKTDSEIEALILESQLIKKYRPPFNIMLRDDKQYFYVVFMKERFPRIFITHRPKGPPSEALVKEGPFTDGGTLKTVLRFLRRIFPYCACRQKHNNYCLNYHIGNCPGFCCLKKEAAAKQVMAYKKNIAAIKEILSGKKKSLIGRFEKELNAIARKERFEQAIELRDKIEKLKNVFENARIVNEMSRKEIDWPNDLAELKKALNLSILPKRIEGYDVSNIQGEFATGAMVVFMDGKPDKDEYRKFKIKLTATPNDAGMLKEILTRRFKHREWKFPNLIIIDGGKGQLSAAKAAVPKKIPAIAQTKDARHKGHHIYASTKKSAVPLKNLPPAIRNLILQIDAEAHRFAIGYYRKLHKEIFK